MKEQEEKRIAIDVHLKRCAAIKASLGQDSTEEEKIRAKHAIKREYLIIKDIDEEFYNTLTPYKEEKEL